MEKAQDQPALFYFAGNGSLTSDGLPTLVPWDARTAEIPNDILLQDLAQQAQQRSTNLVAIIDAGWAPGEQLPWGAPAHCRFVAPDRRPRPAPRVIRLAGPATEPDPERAWEPDSSWQYARQQTEQAARSLQMGAPPSILPPFKLSSHRRACHLVQPWLRQSFLLRLTMRQTRVRCGVC